MLTHLQEFLDSIVIDANVNESKKEMEAPSESNHTTPTDMKTPHQPSSSINEQLPRLSTMNLVRTLVHDVSVEVLVAPVRHLPKLDKKTAYKNALQASCIISIWSIEDDTRYMTLTFTSATTTEIAQPVRSSSRIVQRTSTSSFLSKSHRSESSSSSGPHSGNSSSFASKVNSPVFPLSEFPPRGPPIRGKNNISNSASLFQKASQLKDAILNSINMPAYGS